MPPLATHSAHAQPCQDGLSPLEKGGNILSKRAMPHDWPSGWSLGPGLRRTGREELLEGSAAAPVDHLRVALAVAQGKDAGRSTAVSVALATLV